MILLRIGFFLLLLPINTLSAETLRVSLGQLPVISESKDKGILPELMKAYQKVYPEGVIQVEVTPFKRSIENVLTGKADLHAPILKDPKKTDQELGFTHSDANIFSVIFALYTNKNSKPLDMAHLEKYKIEVESAHVTYFDFPVIASSCLECSLKKVDFGRINGFIFAALESDNIVKKQKLKNIRSQFFRSYEGKFILPIGENSKKTNALLTRLNNKVKANGDYQHILGFIDEYYKNWKPTP